MREKSYSNPLAGKVAVVTGASSGVGRAIALALAEQRADLALVGRNAKRLASVTTEAARRSPKVKSYRIDLLRDEQINRLRRALQRDFKRIDTLVHAAGVIALGPFDRAPLSRLDQQYRCNVRAPYALTQKLLPMLIANKGQVVFMNSTAGLVANAEASQYSATKHALRALADSLRAEVNPHGVRVVSIYPGRTATPMQARIHAYEGKPYVAEQLIQPGDVACVVVDALRQSKHVEITDIHLRPRLKPRTP